MKTVLLFLIICYYQNKTAILICFLQVAVTLKLMHTIFLKTVSISQRLHFVIILIFLFYFNEHLEITF